jgi:hypothetical protein
VELRFVWDAVFNLVQIAKNYREAQADNGSFHRKNRMRRAGLQIVGGDFRHDRRQ